LKWNWDSAGWTRAPKVLLGIATIWPMLYMGLFFGIFLVVFLFAARQPDFIPKNIDLIQLERKIQNDEIKELIIRRYEIEAVDVNGRRYSADHSSEATRQELIALAREIGTNGRPRVAKVEENTVGERPPAPAVSALFSLGFMGLFMVHLLTILLILSLMPFYIILAVKNERLDQTMRIIWVVLLCTLGMLANPVYWYLYVWRKPDSNKPLNSADLNQKETI